VEEKEWMVFKSHSEHRRQSGYRGVVFRTDEQKEKTKGERDSKLGKVFSFRRACSDRKIRTRFARGWLKED
jgi:hypothetical protein